MFKKNRLLLIVFLSSAVQTPHVQGMLWASSLATAGCCGYLLARYSQYKNYIQVQVHRDLLQAVASGNYDCCEQALAWGANSNAKNDVGQSALHVACTKNQLEIARLLLEWGALVHAPDETGRTALHAACRTGNLALVKLLLAKGADINALTRQGDAGKSPLYFAGKYNHLDVVTFLACYKNGGARIQLKEIAVGKTMDIQNFLATISLWEDLQEQIYPEQIQEIVTDPTSALPLLIRPGLAKIVLNRLKTYDQEQTTQVVQAVATAFFAHTTKPHDKAFTAFSTQQMASVARDILKNYLVKKDWDTCLESASEPFKKQVHNNWMFSQLENNQTEAQTKIDVTFTFAS